MNAAASAAVEPPLPFREVAPAAARRMAGEGREFVALMLQANGSCLLVGRHTSRWFASVDDLEFYLRREP